MKPIAAPFACLSYLLAACTSGPPVASRPVASVPDLIYTLELADTRKPRLRVTVELRAARDGTTMFDLDSWGRVDHPDDGFENVTATSGGRAVAVEHAPHVWVVRGAPGEWLVLRYEIAASGDADRLEKRHHPIVRARLIHLFGNNALVSPRHLDDQRPKQIALRWAGFTDAGWTTLSSHGGETTARIALTLEEFRDAEFLASDRVHVIRRRAGGGVLIAALVEGEWSFGATELADVTAKLVDAAVQLMGEPLPSRFLADLLPFRIEGFWGGTALHHAFVAQADPATPLVRHGKRPVALAWMFAHELFHTWNGRAIAPLVEDGEKWFTEGFTNFFARRMMLRAGLATIEDYAANLNATLYDYATSPLRNAPDVAFGLAGDRQRAMAYTRGDLVAIVLDAEIRRVSAGTRNLDNLMRDLLADARAGGKIDETKLVARFARETSPELAAKLRGVIEHGDTLEIDPATYEPCLHGDVHATAVFDLGFDFNASASKHRVVGLRTPSAATAAGLREGDELVGWSFASGLVDQTVVLHVRRGGTEREVSYVPKGSTVPILAFRVGAASACGGRL